MVRFPLTSSLCAVIGRCLARSVSDLCEWNSIGALSDDDITDSAPASGVGGAWLDVKMRPAELSCVELPESVRAWDLCSAPAGGGGGGGEKIVL